MLNACPDDGPTMVVDLTGTVHIVWPTVVDGPEPAMRFFHASTRDGVTFTARQQVPTLGSPKPSHPQMALDECGALVLTWDEAQGSTRRAAMRRLTPLASGDVKLGEPQVISGATPASYPVVAPSGGAVVAAWTDSSKDGAQSRIAVRQIALPATCQ
jgi:hypothetical protein